MLMRISSALVALLAVACGAKDADVDGNGGGAGGQEELCDASPEPTGDEAFDRVAQFFVEKSRAQGVPGGAFVVYHKGELRTLIFGSKRRGRCEPIGPETRFNAGRLGYVMTALAAVRSGLDLDAPVTAWMPEFVKHLADPASTSRAEGVTLRRLLSFSSGYWPGFWWPPGYCPIAQVPPEAWSTDPEGLAAFFDHTQGKIHYDPGRMSMHSDASFALAARVLERGSRKIFPELFEQLVAKDSGLAVTIDQDVAHNGDFAGAGTTGGDPLCAVQWSTWGAYASTDDLGKLIRSLAIGGGDGVLSIAEVRALLGEDSTNAIAPTVGVGAALGMFQVPFPPFGTLAYREGYYGGPATFLVVPQEQFAFASVQNEDVLPGFPVEIRGPVLDAYFPEREPHDLSRPASTFGELAGEYEADSGSRATIRLSDAKELELALTGETYIIEPAPWVTAERLSTLGQSIDEDWFAPTEFPGRIFRIYRDTASTCCTGSATVRASGCTGRWIFRAGRGSWSPPTSTGLEPRTWYSRCPPRAAIGWRSPTAAPTAWERASTRARSLGSNAWKPAGCRMSSDAAILSWIS
jgi:CubicO group peptidase (beta-lactamase class C family)